MSEYRRLNIMLGILFILLITAIMFILLDPAKKPNQFVYNDDFVITVFRVPSAPNVIFYNIDLLVGDTVYSIPLRNNPEDIEEIPVSGLEKVSWLSPIPESNNYDISANEVFVSFDPNLSGGDLILAGGQIIRIVGSGQGGIYKKVVAGAITREEEGLQTQVRNCDNANSNTGIIELRLGENNKVFTENNDCIIIEGESYPDLIKSSDRFLLSLLGVIQ